MSSTRRAAIAHKQRYGPKGNPKVVILHAELQRRRDAKLAADCRQKVLHP